MGLSFLVVDDSANIRAFVKKTLAMTELDIEIVHEADNGESGLSMLAENAVDVVITDINMPVMNGLDMIREMKTKKEYNKIKILIISTEGSRQMILESVKAGASGYLRKPFGPEEVMEVLDGMVNGE